MKKHILLILLCASFFNVFAQQQQIDSLKKLLNKTKPADTLRVNLMVELSKTYYLIKPDSGLTYASGALNISNKIGYKKGKMRSLTQVGFSLWVLGNSALALPNIIESLHLAEQLNDKWSIARNYDGMCSIYLTQGDNKSALAYGLKSEAIFREIGDYNNVVNVLNDIAFYYDNIGWHDMALSYNNRALELSIKINEWVWRPQILGNIGALHAKLNNTEIALAYMYKAIGLCITYNETYNLSHDYKTMALIFKSMNQRDSCIFYAQKSFITAKKASIAKDMYEASALLATMYYGNNDHEAAKYFNISANIKDSLFNADKAKQVLMINIAEEQHQHEIIAEKLKAEEERKENLQLAAIGLFIPLFLLLVLILSKTKTHYRIIEYMTILSLLFLFEFITLIADPAIARLTGHVKFFEYSILVAMAGILVPLHHYLTHWLKEKLVHPPSIPVKKTNRRTAK